MSLRGGPPSQLPTLTEVWADPSSDDFVNSTSGLRRLDGLPPALPPPPPPLPRAVTTDRDQAELAPGSISDAALSEARALDPKPIGKDDTAAGVPSSTARVARMRKVAAPAALPPGGGTGDPAPQSAAAESADKDGGVNDDDQLVRAVLQDLQRHVDLMLEYRLRASLAPLLTQLADNLVRELRQELVLTLRDVVKRAVNQELLRRRKR
jgi:hypothetical protein